MDIERVNIVINYDMPEDSDTYLHRVSYHSFFMFNYFCILSELLFLSYLVKKKQNC